MEEILNVYLTNLAQAVALTISLLVSYYVLPFIKSTMIPKLKEQRNYDVIQKLVLGVEQMAQSGAIQKVDKKDMVVKMLEGKGITVNDEINVLIESCVKQLDLMTSTAVSEITNNTVVKDNNDTKYNK